MFSIIELSLVTRKDMKNMLIFIGLLVILDLACGIPFKRADKEIEEDAKF